MPMNLEEEQIIAFIKENMTLTVSIERTRATHAPVHAELRWNDKVVLTETNKYYAYQGGE